MLEDKQKEVAPGEVLSATDQGITITAVQSIVDSYGADLFFRVEGFTLPEGRNPELFWDRDDVTIDGSTEFHSSMTGWFYDGTTRNEAGEWVYASNGQPVEFGNDKYQSAIYQWVADDGSLEYQVNIRFRDNGEHYWGKEFSIHFNGIGVGAEKGGIMEEPLVSGSWDLHWTLTGADSTKNSVTLTPNMEIGDSGLTLLEAEVGQKNHPCGLSVGSRLGRLEAAGDAFPRPLSNLLERRAVRFGLFPLRRTMQDGKQNASAKLHTKPSTEFWMSLRWILWPTTRVLRLAPTGNESTPLTTFPFHKLANRQRNRALP